MSVLAKQALQESIGKALKELNANNQMLAKLSKVLETSENLSTVDLYSISRDILQIRDFYFSNNAKIISKILEIKSVNPKTFSSIALDKTNIQTLLTLSYIEIPQEDLSPCLRSGKVKLEYLNPSTWGTDKWIGEVLSIQFPQANEGIAASVIITFSNLIKLED